LFSDPRREGGVCKIVEVTCKVASDSLVDYDLDSHGCLCVVGERQLKNTVMATLLRQLQTRVATVTEVVSKYNKQVLEKNKHYIADHPTVEKCQASARNIN